MLFTLQLPTRTGFSTELKWDSTDLGAVRSSKGTVWSGWSGAGYWMWRGSTNALQLPKSGNDLWWWIIYFYSISKDIFYGWILMTLCADHSYAELKCLVSTRSHTRCDQTTSSYCWSHTVIVASFDLLLSSSHNCSNDLSLSRKTCIICSSLTVNLLHLLAKLLYSFKQLDNHFYSIS